MSEPKPIFIVIAPNYFPSEQLEETAKLLNEKMNDYHVLVIKSNSDEFMFQAFYNKDIIEADIEEIKQFVKDNLK